jgi:hypothetical protein
MQKPSECAYLAPDMLVPALWGDSGGIITTHLHIEYGTIRRFLPSITL